MLHDRIAPQQYAKFLGFTKDETGPNIDSAMQNQGVPQFRPKELLLEVI